MEIDDLVCSQGLKVRYRAHLKKQLFPAIKKVYKREDWISVQDGSLSHTANLTQQFLKDTLNRRFIKWNKWPPYSPDSNPLDYYF